MTYKKSSFTTQNSQPTRVNKKHCHVYTLFLCFSTLLEFPMDHPESYIALNCCCYSYCSTPSGHIVTGQENLCTFGPWTWFIIKHLSFIHVQGPQLNWQKHLNVLIDAMDHVFDYFKSYELSSDVLLCIDIQGPNAHTRFFLLSDDMLSPA